MNKINFDYKFKTNIETYKTSSIFSNILRFHDGQNRLLFIEIAIKKKLQFLSVQKFFSVSKRQDIMKYAGIHNFTKIKRKWRNKRKCKEKNKNKRHEER